MFHDMQEFVKDYICSLGGTVTIERAIVYSDNKLEYVFSVEKYMASLSILSNLTYDYFDVEIESEKIRLSKILNFDRVEDLYDQIREDLSTFSQLE